MARTGAAGGVATGRRAQTARTQTRTFLSLMALQVAPVSPASVPATRGGLRQRRGRGEAAWGASRGAARPVAGSGAATAATTNPVCSRLRWGPRRVAAAALTAAPRAAQGAARPAGAPPTGCTTATCGGGCRPPRVDRRQPAFWAEAPAAPVAAATAVALPVARRRRPHRFPTPARSACAQRAAAAAGLGAGSAGYAPKHHPSLYNASEQRAGWLGLLQPGCRGIRGCTTGMGADGKQRRGRQHGSGGFRSASAALHATGRECPPPRRRGAASCRAGTAPGACCSSDTGVNLGNAD